MTIPDPSPKANIYAIKMFLEQTTHATSPRDGPSAIPISRTRPFEVCSVGKSPHPQQRLSKQVPAIWRGTEKDHCEIEGYARLPDDEFARPSTPEGYATGPIQAKSKADWQNQYSAESQPLARHGSLVLDRWGRRMGQSLRRVQD